MVSNINPKIFIIIQFILPRISTVFPIENGLHHKIQNICLLRRHVVSWEDSSLAQNAIELLDQVKHTIFENKIHLERRITPFDAKVKRKGKVLGSVSSNKNWQKGKRRALRILIRLTALNSHRVGSSSRELLGYLLGQIFFGYSLSSLASTLDSLLSRQ